MRDKDDTFPVPDDSEQESLGDVFADYLSLVEETIRTQVTDDDIRARIRNALELAVSEQDRKREQEGQIESRHSWGTGDLRNHRSLLDELTELVHDPRQGPVVLAGPGGTGKTTLARALAERVLEEGGEVRWISAADPVTLSRDLREAARELGGASEARAIAQGAADAVDRFWRLLGHASPGWLLVFDEADDPRVLAAGGSAAGVQDLTGWVRSSACGLALVTSRESDPRMWGAARVLGIDGLPEADAAQMLLALAPSAGDEDQARTLARRLHGHPLSLRLAASYLHSQAAQGTTFAAYERALDVPAQADIGEQGRRQPAVSLMQAQTARALELSLDGLARRGVPQARPVLQLASCYAPATIPVSLLNVGSLTGTGLITDSVTGSPAAHDRTRQALRELEDAGILEPAEGGMTLHTAITEAGRASLDGPDRASAVVRHAAIELLHASVSQLPCEEPESWPQYFLLGPHLLSLLENASARVDREHLLLLLETTAITASAFNLSGASQAGIVLCERALARSTALGGEHRAALRVRHAMTWAMAYRGDLDTAEALYHDNLQARLRVLGPDDPDTLASRHELGWIAACQDDWATAEERYRGTLAASIRVQGPDDPRTLLTRHELAWAIANQGPNRLGEALRVCRAVLVRRRRVLGAEHPRTLTSLHELAWITARLGSWERAETAYRELLDLRLRILGGDHPETLVIRHELAWVAARRGRLQEAESRYSDVLKQRLRILGEDHPDTLATRRALEALRRGRIIDARHLA